MDYNFLIAVGIVFGLWAFLYYLVPWLKKHNAEYYDEVKLALLLCGYAFRDDKVKNIADIAYEIVDDLESLAITPEEKHNEAVTMLSQKILTEMHIDLDDDALDMIVQLAVTLLPKTHATN